MSNDKERGSAGKALAGQAVGLNEPLLGNDYPVYADYLYVADGKVIRSHLHGATVWHLKRDLGAKEIRRCDIYGRQQQRASASPGEQT